MREKRITLNMWWWEHVNAHFWTNMSRLSLYVWTSVWRHRHSRTVFFFIRFEIIGKWDGCSVFTQTVKRPLEPIHMFDMGSTKARSCETTHCCTVNSLYVVSTVESICVYSYGSYYNHFQSNTFELLPCPFLSFGFFQVCFLFRVASYFCHTRVCVFVAWYNEIADNSDDFA